MKDRYKFRAKMLDKPDTWVYGGYWEVDDIAVIIHQVGANMMQHTAVDPSTVGQCTGLVDSKKQQIYEDDLLEDTEGNTYRVWQEAGKWLYGGTNKEWDDYLSKLNEYSCTITGNTHSTC